MSQSYIQNSQSATLPLPKKVTIYEVGPRDGLQNEKAIIPTDTKIDFINRLSQTGLEFIEATAFVSPKWVPQMADHEQIMDGIKRHENVCYPVLVPNIKGFERACSYNPSHIAVFAAASETFSQKNINASIDESLKRFDDVCRQAINKGIKVRGYVSCIAGCPYEGDVDPGKVAYVAKALFDSGCYEVSLGDTIGVGTPISIAKVIQAVRNLCEDCTLALHCHDTYGTALVNIMEGLRHGISIIDASVAGLGGCPYAPGASGNVASEDVVYLMHKMGIETGIDLISLLDVANFISQQLNRDLMSKAGRALQNQQ